jgi:hypothetical protein
MEQENKSMQKRIKDLEARELREENIEKVIVQDCGIPEINGDYELCGKRSNDAPAFTKTGLWENEQMVFKIFRGFNLRTGIMGWYICGLNDRKFERVANPYSNITTFLTQFTLLLIGQDKTYFYVAYTNQHSMVPPVHNWEVSRSGGRNRGVDPPPKVYVAYS